ncbi:uncharacterized protein LOC133743342 isoform X2 [Rosa rugosa]|uniref:uncharacterized protein LOC133743342 isoform X2 n=1 Tax=Rosa rugosa TaxID=74645 RepID=UPI002B41093B|nr:uncharacterized protein LOC133743342 isoform X2 [Rosa rugosa]
MTDLGFTIVILCLSSTRTRKVIFGIASLQAMTETSLEQNLSQKRLRKVILNFCITNWFTSLSCEWNVIEQSGEVEVPGPCYRIIPAVVTTAVGQMLAMAGVFGVGFVLDCLLLVHKAW